MSGWENMFSRVESILRLDFLFSGLEVSPLLLFSARLLAFVIVTVGLTIAVVYIAGKLLDCLGTLFRSLEKIPTAFYFILLIAVPLPESSLGVQWAGYLLLIACFMAIAIAAVLIAALWRYGVDQTVKFINAVRSKTGNVEHREGPVENAGGLRSADANAGRPTSEVPEPNVVFGPDTREVTPERC